MANYYHLTNNSDMNQFCPYCEMPIRIKRWQYHLMKCKKNHPEMKMDTCPFNATHIIPSSEIRHHIATCRDKGVIERNLLHELNSQSAGGNCSVPDYNTEWPCDNDESWDDDADEPSILDPYTSQPTKRFVPSAPERLPQQLPYSMQHHALQQVARGRAAPRVVNTPTVGRPQQQPTPSTLPIGLGRGGGRGGAVPAARPSSYPATMFNGIGRGQVRMNGASSQSPVSAASDANASSASSSDTVPEPKDSIKEIRKIKKKLRAIKVLEEMIDDGDALSNEQIEKISKKVELESELANLTL